MLLSGILPPTKLRPSFPWLRPTSTYVVLPIHLRGRRTNGALSSSRRSRIHLLSVTRFIRSGDEIKLLTLFPLYSPVHTLPEAQTSTITSTSPSYVFFRTNPSTVPPSLFIPLSEIHSLTATRTFAGRSSRSIRRQRRAVRTSHSACSPSDLERSPARTRPSSGRKYLLSGAQQVS